jgi:biotin operon repressor
MPAREADDIQSLRIGVETLRLLNSCDSLSSSELANELGLSRAAAYRVLKTLSVMGYVVELRRTRGTRYRLTVLVRGLSDGFDGDVRLLAVAQPLMLDSTSLHGWPLALVTPVGDRCIVRFNTDHATSRVIRRYRACHRQPRPFCCRSNSRRRRRPTAPRLKRPSSCRTSHASGNKISRLSSPSANVKIPSQCHCGWKVCSSAR